MTSRFEDDRDYEYEEEDPPPPHVAKAMSQIAIYAATYGTDSMYLHDPVVWVPIGIVREWLRDWGYTFDDAPPEGSRHWARPVQHDGDVLSKGA